MKRFLLIALVVLLILSMFGCSGVAKFNDCIPNVKYADNEYISMELIEQDGMCLIYRDRLTDVMYLVIGGYSQAMMTPILNADGTPKLYGE